MDFSSPAIPLEWSTCTACSLQPASVLRAAESIIQPQQAKICAWCKRLGVRELEAHWACILYFCACKQPGLVQHHRYAWVVREYCVYMKESCSWGARASASALHILPGEHSVKDHDMWTCILYYFEQLTGCDARGAVLCCGAGRARCLFSSFNSMACSHNTASQLIPREIA